MHELEMHCKIASIERRLATLESAAKPADQPAPTDKISARERIADLINGVSNNRREYELATADRILREVVQPMLVACAQHAAAESKIMAPSLWSAVGALNLAARIIEKETGG